MLVTSETWSFTSYWSSAWRPKIENVQVLVILIFQEILWKEFSGYHIAILVISWTIIHDDTHPRISLLASYISQVRWKFLDTTEIVDLSESNIVGPGSFRYFMHEGYKV